MQMNQGALWQQPVLSLSGKAWHRRQPGRSLPLHPRASPQMLTTTTTCSARTRVKKKNEKEKKLERRNLRNTYAASAGASK